MDQVQENIQKETLLFPDSMTPMCKDFITGVGAGNNSHLVAPGEEQEEHHSASAVASLDSVTCL